MNPGRSGRRISRSGDGTHVVAAGLPRYRSIAR